MRQTAVEWLEQELRKNENIRWRGANIEDMFDQAKQMEKQQQIDFATDFARDYIGYSSVCTDANDIGPAAHYYNQKNKV